MNMDRETIIKLAREAGLISSGYNGFDATGLTKTQINFAKLAAEHGASVEREACAKVCDALEEMHVEGFVRRRSTNRDCAAAIRERSANAGARNNT